MMPKNTMLIISLLLRNPLNKYNVNQIARELDVSVGSAYKIVKHLEKKEILKSMRMANAICYSLNMENREARKICEISIIEDKDRKLSENPVAKVYAKELENYPSRSTVLFGSILTGKERAKDVDALFIIGGKKEVKKVNSFCLEVSRTKTKPIVPFIMTALDLRNNLQGKNPVVLDIIKTGIVLSGEDVIVEAILNV